MDEDDSSRLVPFRWPQVDSERLTIDLLNEKRAHDGPAGALDGDGGNVLSQRDDACYSGQHDEIAEPTHSSSISGETSGLDEGNLQLVPARIQDTRAGVISRSMCYK